MTRASTYTLLSLDRFARMLGINPVHFAGAHGDVVFPMTGFCGMVWPQWAWQTVEDLVSREELALAIFSAENDIKRILGYSPALTWETDEIQPFPYTYDRSTQNTFVGVNGRPKFLKTKFGKVREGGQRRVDLVDNPDVTYDDVDNDGFDEIGAVTGATVLTGTDRLKVYFAGHGGDPEWEIRPLRSVSIIGGVYTIEIDSWLLINPDLWEAYPVTGGFVPINIDNPGNFVGDVEVYHEYTDPASAASEIRWSAGHVTDCGCTNGNCNACTHSTQAGCIQIRDRKLGIVVPIPANYDSVNGVWGMTELCACRPPDEVTFWYRAGETSAEYERGGQDPLSMYWAQTIAWMATARLEKPVCECGNVQLIADELRRDAARSTRDEARMVDMNLLSNPFGTRLGEIKAWQRVMNFANDQIAEAGAL